MRTAILETTTLVRVFTTARLSEEPWKRGYSIRSGLFKSGFVVPSMNAISGSLATTTGMRVVYMEEFYELGCRAVIEEARRIVGDGANLHQF